MTDLPDEPNRDAALLRAEQNFFEQAQVQHQHHSQQLAALQAQLSEEQGQLAGLEDTIQILRHQLAQAQEEIGTANGRLEHALATQIPPITLVQLAQAQEELAKTQEELAKTQEDLAHALRQLDTMQRWQQLARNSLKLQKEMILMIHRH